MRRCHLYGGFGNPSALGSGNVVTDGATSHVGVVHFSFKFGISRPSGCKSVGTACSVLAENLSSPVDCSTQCYIDRPLNTGKLGGQVG